MSTLPCVFCLDPRLLVAGRACAAAGDDVLTPALEALLDGARAALEIGPCSVMDKTQLLDRDALGEVARLVDLAATVACHVIGEQLQCHCGGDRGDEG
jgi:hypothetical protein